MRALKKSSYQRSFCKFVQTNSFHKFSFLKGPFLFTSDSGNASTAPPPVGRFPIEIQTEIRYLIICCYLNIALLNYDNNKL